MALPTSRRQQDLRDKVVVITGAARGIGAQTARGLIAGGARVALIDLLQDEVAAVAAELGDRAAAS